MNTDTLLENACISNEELVETNQFLCQAVLAGNQAGPEILEFSESICPTALGSGCKSLDACLLQKSCS